ncbi:MAG: PQQ-dependent sugar dehydrogenase [Planctomycetia bacterium]|nr:PQQ-dependent sugar dehydrogenase [Planctomycetia bacterium]
MKLPAAGRLSFVFVLLLGVGASSPAQTVFPPPTPQTVFPVPDWQVAKPETQQMSSEGLELVGKWLKENGSKTGLVVRHGKIVGEWYFDDAKAESRFPVYSTSKSFASTAAGLAIASGKLKLDSKVGDFFPEADPPQKREITVRHLLSMTSGAHNDNAILDKSDLFSFALSSQLPMDFAPGEKWEYNNSGLSLLSPVVHKATGQNVAQILDDQIFKKIGIPREDWTWEDRDRMPIPYSGLHITARSLARFGLLFLNKGAWQGKKLIAADWVAQASHTSQDLNKRYGYLWWNNSTGAWPGVPSDAYAAMGKFDNDMLIVPSLDLIVIRQVGDDSANKRQLKIGDLFALAVSVASDLSPSFKLQETASDLEVEKAFPNLKINRPILLTHAGDGSNRLFVPSQLGTIHVFPNDPSVERTKIFLDIESRVVFKDKENEKGFLGMAFHPKYRENGQFFIYYTPTATPKPNTVVVSRFRVSKNDPNQADPNSEEEILRIEHPFWNHKGGTLVFGPDGYLYIAVGDGGLGNDPFGNGQNLKTHLGKILRIDVDHRDKGKKYAIPKNNPFAGQGEKAYGEIWSYGMRNPWRIAFDRQTGTLWCADVGQDLWEEIDLIVKGGNYGWNLREGLHKFGTSGADPRPDLVDPIWEYHHETGKSITGGVVYRGTRLPQLVGCYLYADYVTGKVWALKYDEQKKQAIANYSIRGNIMPIISFGEDELGEVYYTTDTGNIFRFRPIAQTAASGG